MPNWSNLMALSKTGIKNMYAKVFLHDCQPNERQIPAINYGQRWLPRTMEKKIFQTCNEYSLRKKTPVNVRINEYICLQNTHRFLESNNIHLKHAPPDFPIWIYSNLFNYCMTSGRSGGSLVLSSTHSRRIAVEVIFNLAETLLFSSKCRCWKGEMQR